MPAATIYEIIGYIASILVAISLMMSSILKLRVLNLVGSLFFTAYGLLIGAYPVAAVNFFIVLINIYYLYQMFSAREFYRLLEVRPDSEYLGAFLNYYKTDIQRFQPGFTYNPANNLLTFFILRNMIPAGLVIGEINTNELHVLLDYAIPGYRDLKTARFVYHTEADALRKRGIRKIVTQSGAPAHAQYLEKMGFRPETSPSGQTTYCLMLR